MPQATYASASKQTSTGKSAGKSATAVKKARGGTKKSAASAAVTEAALASARATLAGIQNERDDKVWIGNPAVGQYSVGRPKKETIDFGMIVKQVLTESGVNLDRVEQSAINGLLEHARLYAWHLVADAQDYAIHRTCNAAAQITGPDLMLAYQSQDDRMRGQDKVTNNLTAFFEEEVNVVPLPRIPDDCYNGIVLPPSGQTLLARTYDIIPSVSLGSSSTSKMGERVPPKRRISSKAKSNKIDIKLKSLAPSPSTSASQAVATSQASAGQLGPNVGEKRKME